MTTSLLRAAGFSIAAAAALVGPLPLPAQAPPPGGSVVAERATATVVEIPVNVIGKDGKPVAGLTKADFELFDDNRRQEISSVDVIDVNAPIAASAAGAPAAKPAEVPPAARRHFLLVFDLSYSSPRTLIRAREGALSFVANELKPSDQGAIATFSVENGWKLLVNFTQDRAQLSRAIETLGMPAFGIHSVDPLAFAFAPPGPDSAAPFRSKTGEAMDAMILENLQDFEQMRQGASDDRARGRVAQLLQSLQMMGQALDAVRGRKHVLYFSEGFETRLIAGNAGQTASPGERAAPNQDTSAEAALSGELWKIDSDARFGSTSTRSTLSQALSVFNRSDAIVHTVDVSGLRAQGEAGEKRASGTDALYTIAAATGGDFIRNANQLGPQLAQLQERTGLTYLLAYQPKKLEKPGQFHALRVKVSAPGARVVARSGYYEPKPFRALSPIERLLATGDTLTGGAPRQEIPTRLLAAAFPFDDAVAQVPIILEIPGPTLLGGEKEGQASVEIYAYATDAKGTLADYLTQTMGLEIAKVRSALEAGGIKFYGTLHLPPGDYSVKTLVRNSATGQVGWQTAAVSVPKMPGGAATVLPPVFAAEPGGWLMVKARPRTDAPARADDYPFAVAGDSIVPTVVPTLENGKETRIAVFTYNLGAGKPLEVESKIVGRDGSARPVKLAVVKQSDSERAGGRKLLLSFKPEGLAPGRYELKVAVAGAQPAKLESASAFDVRSP
jgi:VWFA-related protein